MQRSAYGSLWPQVGHRVRMFGTHFRPKFFFHGQESIHAAQGTCEEQCAEDEDDEDEDDLLLSQVNDVF